MFLISVISARWLPVLWRSLISLLLLQIQITKEFFKMVFTKSSMIAKSYVVLILAGEMTLERVPNIGNLRQIVMEILASENTD